MVPDIFFGEKEMSLTKHGQSSFGDKFTAESGILQLMEDLGNAVTGNADVIMLGGGNPSHIPGAQAYFRQRMADILANETEFERLIGDYDPPQGMPQFCEAVADLLREEYGWQISAENVALTNGSQTAFFYLFNLLAGRYKDGSRKKILLPLAPEYIGYLDAGLDEDIFVAHKPTFEFIDDHTFKYHIDFDALEIGDDISAICVSRPTNPTGNVLTNDEIEQLRAISAEHQIPLIIDNAYGAPFPRIIFDDVTPVWDDNIILCLSLSKLGLPGVRTGIIIANERVTKAIAALNAVISLAPSSLGAGLALDLMRTGEVLRLSREVVMPYYKQRSEQAAEWVHGSLAGTPYYLHKPEGAFFFWLWFKGLPITCDELYNRLKDRGMIVVPGHYFFPGLDGEWDHKHECIRMNYTQDEAKVREGIRILGEVIREAYAQQSAPVLTANGD